MTRTAPRLASICVAIALLGCNDNVDQGIEDLTDVPSFAVHRSDFASAAVALLDGDGKLLDRSYISSGTETPGLNAPLHGDIALPTMPCHADELTIVARFGGDYVLEVDLDQGEVTRQVATQASDLDDEAAYRANPQDILCLPDDVALVSRFEPNLAAEGDDLDAGDDIAVIDMHAEEITSRIDLAGLRTMVEGQNADGEDVEELAYARPGAIVRLGDYAVVGLARLSASWIAAPGMVAVIDVEQRELVGGFELDGLKNCTGVSEVVGRDDAVLVGCSGYPFGDAATAGLALLSIDENGELHEDAALRDQDAPVLYAGIVSLGGTRLLAVATGDYAADTGDKAYILDIASGERERLFSTDTSGAIGSGAYRSETGLLLVPDADVGVRLFDVAADDVTASGEVELDPALPARTVRGIRP